MRHDEKNIGKFRAVNFCFPDTIKFPKVCMIKYFKITIQHVYRLKDFIS